MLEIENLNVEVDNKQILNNFNLKINKGEIHAIMGPNGIGKSTICKTIMGSPNYIVTNGSITYNGKDEEYIIWQKYLFKLLLQPANRFFNCLGSIKESADNEEYLNANIQPPCPLAFIILTEVAGNNTAHCKKSDCTNGGLFFTPPNIGFNVLYISHRLNFLEQKRMVVSHHSIVLTCASAYWQ